MRLSLLSSLILLCGVCLAQTSVQEKHVFDFSGGLVNSVINAKMDDNMATVLDNYDVEEFGGITRRSGIVNFPIDSVLTNIQSIIPHYKTDETQLLIVAIDTAHYLIDSAMTTIARLSNCDEAGHPCTTLERSHFYSNINYKTYPWNYKTISKDGRTGIISSKSEYLIYDGIDAFPARPLGPGQPRLTVIDSVGDLHGKVQYRYCYYSGAAEDPYSNYSSPSWPVFVDSGAVYVDHLSDDGFQGTVSLLLFRKINDGNWRYIARRSEGVHTFDFYDSGTPDSAGSYEGYGENNLCCYNSGDSVNSNWPPGACTLSVYPNLDTGEADSWDPGIFTDMSGNSIEYPTLSYCYYYIDSSGRSSYPSTPSCINTEAVELNTDSLVIKIDFLEGPADSNIAYRVLARKIDADTWGGGADDTAYYGKWFIIDSLSPATATHYDHARILDVHTSGRLILTGENKDCNYTITDIHYDDSLITFRPTDAVYFKNRVYAIGDADYKNRIYFSEFGRLTTFGYDKFLNIGYESDELALRLWPHGDNLLIFRQNSIFALSGVSFYQYSISPISLDIGLTFPRAVASINSNVFMGNVKGIYTLSNMSERLSYPIDNSVDSMHLNGKISWMGNVNQSLWVSYYDSSKTYIYSPTPNPHWKCYTFGINDGVLYDSSYNVYNIEKNKYMFIVNDSLYLWNYSATDTLDGADTITAVYQSKYFFEDPDREMVLYVDIYGTGICDTLDFTFLSDYGQDTLGTATRAIDFDSGVRQRVKVNQLAKNFSVKWNDHGMGDYTIKGYTIGYIDNWDKGKIR